MIVHKSRAFRSLLHTVVFAFLAIALASPAYAVDAEALVNETLDQAPDLSKLPHKKVDLKIPPFVHAYDEVARGGPKVVQFTLPIIEKELVVDKSRDTRMRAMTFGGSVPGPLMVVHEGDYVEVTLVNPDFNEQVHNIDFHAATGAMGGGDITHVAPGQEVTIRFKATRAGVFIYHCAPGSIMTPWHIVAGMNGAVMVLPRDGLRDRKGKLIKYDRTYYIGESDFYIPQDSRGNYKKYSNPSSSMADTLDVMRGLIPTHQVFNGSVGALTGKNALTSKVGESVLFIHSTATRDTRPHLIGGHGDYVWERGKFDNPPLRGLETWFIAGGSAGAAIYQFKQPGLYTYVNHNLIEGVMLGAAAQVKVDGDHWDHDLMTLPSPAGPIKPETKIDLPHK